MALLCTFYHTFTTKFSPFLGIAILLFVLSLGMASVVLFNEPTGYQGQLALPYSYSKFQNIRSFNTELKIGLHFYAEMERISDATTVRDKIRRNASGDQI